MQLTQDRDDGDGAHGAALQQAAESADTDASRKWVGELSRYLDRVEIVSD